MPCRLKGPSPQSFHLQPREVLPFAGAPTSTASARAGDPEASDQQGSQEGRRQRGWSWSRHESPKEHSDLKTEAPPAVRTRAEEDTSGVCAKLISFSQT